MLLLVRKGIGNAQHLKELGINVVADRPGVGENLQDHLEVYFQLKCKQKITLYKHLNIFSKALIGLQWLLFKSGLGTTNHFETLGFIRSKAGIKYPDIQYHLLPLAMNYDGSSPFKGHGFQNAKTPRVLYLLLASPGCRPGDTQKISLKHTKNEVFSHFETHNL